MNRPIALFLLLCTAIVARADPRVDMREGFRAFDKGEFAAAATAFEKAGATARESGLDPTVAQFNRGVALYRQSQWDAAADAFFEARLTPDLDRQARALYNAGTARLKQVEAAIEARDGQRIEQHLNEAIEWLGQSLLIRPNREDARHQLELALARRESLAMYVMELGRVAQTADQLIAQHQFEEAHGLLAAARERLAPALLLPKPEVKSFEQMLERTGQIVQIIQSQQQPNPSP